MPLSEKQLRFLRGRAHALKPLIQVGQDGLTDGVVAETQRALTDHELIKVRVRAASREARDELLDQLAQRTGASWVTRIGHVAVLFKAHATLSKIPLPNP